jgi:hypothetical protein
LLDLPNALTADAEGITDLPKWVAMKKPPFNNEPLTLIQTGHRLEDLGALHGINPAVVVRINDHFSEARLVTAELRFRQRLTTAGRFRGSLHERPAHGGVRQRRQRAAGLLPPIHNLEKDKQADLPAVIAFDMPGDESIPESLARRSQRQRLMCGEQPQGISRSADSLDHGGTPGEVTIPGLYHPGECPRMWKTAHFRDIGDLGDNQDVGPDRVCNAKCGR